MNARFGCKDMTDNKNSQFAERPIKVVETMIVTDEELEKILNEWVVEKGYMLDSIFFAMRESSKRPAMAFLVFYSKDFARFK